VSTRLRLHALPEVSPAQLLPNVRATLVPSDLHPYNDPDRSRQVRVRVRAATLVHLARREHLNMVFTVDHDDFET
jgi:hypothetical protein